MCESMVDLIAFEPDLLISSQIEGICVKLGIQIKIATTIQDLRASLSEEAPKALVLDLDSLATDMQILQELTQKKSYKMVGYYSHVNPELADEAKKSGIELVLPRGAFVTKMRSILSYLTSA
jgi:hypothetical protein